MTKPSLPTAKSVRDLLTTLFGRDVELAEKVAADSRVPATSTVAAYRDDANNTVAVVVADLPSSAYLAAMLGLTSKDSADEEVKRGVLSEASTESLHETLSIMGALFNAEGLPRVGIHAVHGSGETVPPRLAAFAEQIGSRLDLTLTLPGYGSGDLSIVV